MSSKLSYAAVASKLNISERTLYRKVKNGTIRRNKSGFSEANVKTAAKKLNVDLTDYSHTF